MNQVTKVSTQHPNVFVALCAAQSEMDTVRKGSVNPAFKTKYADLSDVFQAVIPALTKNGITLFHYMTDGAMVTALVHGESDTRVECPVPLLVAKNDMQGMKSATTYAKRIGTESLCGVAPEDDDGNAAGKSPMVIEDRQSISVAQFDTLRELIDQAAVDEDVVLHAEKISALHSLPAARFDGLAKRLRATIAKREIAG